MTASAWFFETWSPKDGLAFACRREVDHGGRPARTVWATVALAPPHWQPIAVSRPLARRAERGPFQPGLHDQQGAIGFASLSDLVAMVKQAYLGGGGGPPPVTEPREPPGPPPADLVSHRAREEWEHLRPRLWSQGRSEPQRWAKALAAQMRKPFEDVFRFLAYQTLRSPEPSQDAADWARVIARMGLGSLLDLWPVWRSHRPLFLMTWFERVPAVADGLLFRVPNPLQGRWPRGSLGDVLAWHLASRDHLDDITFEGVALLVFVAAAIVAGTRLRVRPDYAEGPSPELLAEAIAWLLRELPTVDPSSRPGGVLREHLQI
jgi:hypothetical protein